MTTVLDVQNLTVAYFANRSVLNGISLSVSPGQIYGLIGLNGEGKTTLIKTALGLRTPQAGEVRVFGLPQDDDRARAHVAYLPERFDPPWFLSGMDFVSFSARLYGRTPAKEDVMAYADSLGLDRAALSRRAGTYSKGMRQKLGLIATLATGCDFMILDEPMSGLDPRARVQVKNLLLAQKTLGKTIFLSGGCLARRRDPLCGVAAWTA